MLEIRPLGSQYGKLTARPLGPEGPVDPWGPGPPRGPGKPGAPATPGVPYKRHQIDTKRSEQDMIKETLF